MMTLDVGGTWCISRINSSARTNFLRKQQTTMNTKEEKRERNKWLLLSFVHVPYIQYQQHLPVLPLLPLPTYSEVASSSVGEGRYQVTRRWSVGGRLEIDLQIDLPSMYRQLRAKRKKEQTTQEE
jgi:hypothetical protein